jgi:HSP20 family molecular chaperone IbpA
MRNFLTRRNNDFGFNFFDDAFEDFFKPIFYTPSADRIKTDIKETESDYELKLDMPGFEKENINLTLENGYLTVEGKREEKEEDEKNYIRRERTLSTKRSFYVGEAVTEEDVKAKYVNGTLTLVVPKKDRKELPKKNIAIE